MNDKCEKCPSLFTYRGVMLTMAKRLASLSSKACTCIMNSTARTAARALETRPHEAVRTRLHISLLLQHGQESAARGNTRTPQKRGHASPVLFPYTRQYDVSSYWFSLDKRVLASANEMSVSTCAGFLCIGFLVEKESEGWYSNREFSLAKPLPHVH